MTVKEFFNLIGGFDMDSELCIATEENMTKNYTPVEKVAIDYDETTKEMRIIVG